MYVSGMFTDDFFGVFNLQPVYGNIVQKRFIHAGSHLPEY